MRPGSTALTLFLFKPVYTDVGSPEVFSTGNLSFCSLNLLFYLKPGPSTGSGRTP